MGWSAYGFETVAAFAPEYHNPEWDTPRALRASAAFSVVVYALLPLGVGGTLGTEAIANDATAIAFYTQAFDVLVGSALTNVLVVCLIAGLLLSMNTATMDGSRALYGISQDGMTTKALGRLNRYSVPAVAMTADVILNLFLISYFGYPLDILAAGNLGYMLAHVFALTGFLLLRRDRPNWPRPIKLSAAWVPIAALSRRSTCCSSSRVRSSTRTSTATAGTRPGSASACSPSACCSTSGGGSSRTGWASRCARRRRQCRRKPRQRRPPPRRPSSPAATEAYSGRSSHFGSSATALR